MEIFYETWKHITHSKETFIPLEVNNWGMRN